MLKRSFRDRYVDTFSRHRFQPASDAERPMKIETQRICQNFRPMSDAFIHRDHCCGRGRTKRALYTEPASNAAAVRMRISCYSALLLSNEKLCASSSHLGSEDGKATKSIGSCERDSPPLNCPNSTVSISTLGGSLWIVYLFPDVLRKLYLCTV